MSKKTVTQRLIRMGALPELIANIQNDPKLLAWAKALIDLQDVAAPADFETFAKALLAFVHADKATQKFVLAQMEGVA